MPSRHPVVVVGSFIQDLTFFCTEHPRGGQTVIGTFRTGPGGKGSNQAVAAGRAGAKVLYVGAVGDDAFGREAKAFYKAEKIAARWCVKPKLPTGTAGILVDAKGNNEIVVALGANAALAKADLPAEVLAGARVLVVQLEANLVAVGHALKTARKAGVTTVLNPAPMRPDFDPALLKHVDILIPNETEFVALVNALGVGGRRDFTLAELGGLPDDALLAVARGMGVPTVIITLGSRGCLVSTPQGATFLPAHVVKAVDTTGAGDAFVGGFAAGLVQPGADLVSAARFGNAVAALSVTKLGTAPAMPTHREVQKFLKAVAASKKG